METFTNRHVKRLNFIVYIIIFITLSINLLLKIQVERNYQKIQTERQASVNQQLLLSSFHKAAYLCLIKDRDEAKKNYKQIIHRVHRLLYEEPITAHNTRANIKSLERIKKLSKQHFHFLNLALADPQREIDAYSGYVKSAVETIDRIDAEMASIKNRDDRRENAHVDNTIAAFKFSTPTNVFILLTFLLFSLINVVFYRRKHEQTPHAIIPPGVAGNADLIRSVVHEIKSPLNNIILANNLLETNPSSAEVKEAISRNSSKIDQLINELLSPCNRNDGYEFEEVHLEAILEETLQQLETKVEFLNIKIVRRYNKEKCQALVDAKKLKIVFQNIILNAIEAMNKSDKVLLLETRSGKNICEIEIKDNGIGMDEHTLKRIFEPYYTLKKKGSGLGLAHSKEIIQNLGGDIDVQSMPGEGSSFTISLFASGKTSKPKL